MWRMLIFMFSIISSIAMGAGQDGIVAIKGSILDVPCAIGTDAVEQTVDMGVLPVGAIRQQGRGPIRPFSITLTDCVLTAYDGGGWQGFSIVFDGASAGDFFTVFGEARGVVLQLQDAFGRPIIPGEPSPKHGVVQGGSKLQYGLRLVSDASPLRPGEYQSALQFKLEYE